MFKRRFLSTFKPLYNLNRIPIGRTRDIGIIAHIDAGKTTTTERMLFFSGKTKRIGNVDQGDTVTDYLQSERERGITIQLAAITIPWNNHKINIIDTPGHADFTFEVIRSLRVLDGALTILDAVAGVEPQTEKVWKQAQELSIPKILFVNKMDRDGADFNKTIKEIIIKLQTRVVICALPYYEIIDNLPIFKGIIDVVNQKVLIWDLDSDSNGKVVKVVDPKDEIQTTIKHSRESMVETLGEFNEEIIDSFLEHDEDYLAIPPELINRAIRQTCIANQVTPVFCGSAFKNIGIQPIIDAVTLYLPSPLEIKVPEVKTIAIRNRKRHKQQQISTKMDPQKGLVINNQPNLSVSLVFKVFTDSIRGVMTFFRVYSGSINVNTKFVNTRTGNVHLLRNLLLMHGDEPIPVNQISSGNIGVIAGNEEIVTGDTLVSYGTGKNIKDVNISLLPIEVPPPLFNASIIPLTAGDERYMNECIDSLVREDPSLQVTTDEDLGQTILSGMGELHLEIVKDRLVRDMNAKVKFSNVAVSYKETLTSPSATIRVQDPEVSEIFLEIEIDGFEGDAAQSSFYEESGCELLDDNNMIIIEPAAIPQSFYTAIEERRWKLELSLDGLYETIFQGLEVGLTIGGPIIGLSLHSLVIRVKALGYPIEDKTNYKIKLLDLSRKALDMAIKSLPINQFTLLEPIMDTKIYVSSDKLGDVTHDLTIRCEATILAIDDETTENLELASWAIQEASKIYLPTDIFTQEVNHEINSKKIIKAHTPLREMIGYLNKLQSITKGKSTFDMTYLGMTRTTTNRMKTILKDFQ